MLNSAGRGQRKLPRKWLLLCLGEDLPSQAAVVALSVIPPGMWMLKDG